MSASVVFKLFLIRQQFILQPQMWSHILVGHDLLLLLFFLSLQHYQHHHQRFIDICILFQYPAAITSTNLFSNQLLFIIFSEKLQCFHVQTGGAPPPLAVVPFCLFPLCLPAYRLLIGEEWTQTLKVPTSAVLCGSSLCAHNNTMCTTSTNLTLGISLTQEQVQRGATFLISSLPMCSRLLGVFFSVVCPKEAVSRFGKIKNTCWTFMMVYFGMEVT